MTRLSISDKLFSHNEPIDKEFVNVYKKINYVSTHATGGTKGDKGDKGDPGIPGADGTNGTDGVGVPIGGTTGQILAKIDNTNYNTEWIDNSGGTPAAGDVTTDTSNFNNNLSAADDDVQKALDTLDNISIPTQASDLDTDTSNFGGNLSAADDTIQKALDTLDDLDVSGTYQWTELVKAANEVRSSDGATLTDDNTLLFTTTANTKYIIELHFTYNIANSAQGAKHQVAHTGTTSYCVAQAMRARNGASNVTWVRQGAGGVVNDNAFSGAMNYRYNIVLEVGASGGTFSLQWAQYSSGATNLTMERGSYLKYRTYS